MVEVILSILASAGVSGLLVAGLIWFAKTWMGERIKGEIRHEYDQKLESHKQSIQFEYDQKLESHKEQLKAQNAVELEKWKSNLEKVAVEHQIRFERLHDKVAKAVQTLYVKLVRLKQTSFYYAANFNNKDTAYVDKQFREAMDAYSEFEKYFTENKIFFEDKTCDEIGKFQREVSNTIFGLAGLSYESYPPTPDGDEKKRKAWLQNFDRMLKKMPPIMEDIRRQFRALLGAGED